MSFVLSGGFNRSRVFEFRPREYNYYYSVGNYIQSLRDLCYNSDGFVDASRVYNRFKIEGGSIKVTLHAFCKNGGEMDYDDSHTYALLGAARYGKNLNATVPPNSVFESSNWLFPSQIIPLDMRNRYMPYTESITIPIRTGFTSFKKIFGNLYNVLLVFAMAVGGPVPPPLSRFDTDFEIALRLEWKFDCVGEGSAPSALNWVPCMHFDFDRRQGVRGRLLTL